MSHIIKIRQAQPTDCAQLLDLMKQLAVFEGYIEQFKVTETDILTRSFHHQDFAALVAETDNKLIGMLVYYFLPFTYDLTPWLVIKELFVAEAYRGSGTGNQLVQRAIQICRDKGGSRLCWDVLANNLAAQRFYQSLGAYADNRWLKFRLDC